MATTLAPAGPAEVSPPSVYGWGSRLGLLRELDSPSQVFANLTPNWYASVMGTGIVAVAAVSLPFRISELHTAALGMWLLAAAMLIGLTFATIVHWVRHPATARSHVDHPVLSHFYGAPPMAVLTVGAGTLLLGRDVVGLRVALDVDWVAWCTGTATGLAAAVFVPYRLLSRRGFRIDDVFGGWLMPVVPPMVSASTGALLVPHIPAGQLRIAFLLGCYVLFGLALLASAVVIGLIWYRLAMRPTVEARLVPTVWIVLGPLGQSITAANLLGAAAQHTVDARYARAMQGFGVTFGLPVWGLAVLWVIVAASITVGTTRKNLPFSLTWWSFTFPVGTLVTGTAALALHTGSTTLALATMISFAGLVGAWVIVAVRTTSGSLSGRLFVPQ